MKLVRTNLLSFGIISVMGCSAVKAPLNNQYQLNAFSAKQMTSHTRPVTLFVTAPEAVPGYQTDRMFYINKPFQVEVFAKNAWANPPGDMLYPLMIQSLQKTHYFFAVVSGIYSDAADYRLDTQLLYLNQNFLKKPSTLDFSAKVVLTRVADKQVMGSQLFTASIPCLQDTPYGGVVAANKAVWQFTEKMTDYVVSHIKPSTTLKNT